MTHAHTHIQHLQALVDISVRQNRSWCCFESLLFLVNTCPSTIVAVCFLPSLSLALRLSSAPTVHTVIVHCHHQQVPQFQCYTLVSSTTAAAALHTFCFSMSFCLVCAKSYHLLSGLNAWNASTPSEQWLRRNVSRRSFRVSRFLSIFSLSYLLPLFFPSIWPFSLLWLQSFFSYLHQSVTAKVLCVLLSPIGHLWAMGVHSQSDKHLSPL